MMTPLAIYLASILGAAAVTLLLPRSTEQPLLKRLGVVLGCGALGSLWLVLKLCNLHGWGPDAPAFLYHYVFGFIAIAASVRVITHRRPVYAALWFILVVLSSAGLLLTLDAEFVATAAVIIYGGAILVTYMFVLMLASPPQDTAPMPLDGAAGDAEARGEIRPWDRVAREPVWACAAGFTLVAVLLSVFFNGPLPAPSRAEGLVEKADMAAALTESAVKEAGNTQEVGFNLFHGHPLAIELAGILLLVALVGSIVLARTQVHSEDEVGLAGTEDEGASAPKQA